MAGLCPLRCGQTGGVAAVHPRPVFALRSAAIRVRKSTEYGGGDHLPGSRIYLARLRRVSFEAHVAAGRVVVADVGKEVAKEVPFAEGDDVIGCLPADAPDDAFRVWILPRALWSADDLLDAQDPDLPTEGTSVDGVPVAEQKPWLAAVRGVRLRGRSAAPNRFR